ARVEAVSMTEAGAPTIFGELPPGVTCRDRRAAYVVVVRTDGWVAAVRGRREWFLPGGGSLPGERPENSVAREVMEELGRDVRGLRSIGEAIQYFHSSDDDCWYRMTAIFLPENSLARSDRTSRPGNGSIHTPARRGSSTSVTSGPFTAAPNLPPIDADRPAARGVARTWLDSHILTIKM